MMIAPVLSPDRTDRAIPLRWASCPAGLDIGRLRNEVQQTYPSTCRSKR